MFPLEFLVVACVAGAGVQKGASVTNVAPSKADFQIITPRPQVQLISFLFRHVF
jgi:hypothetical protein